MNQQTMALTAKEVAQLIREGKSIPQKWKDKLKHFMENNNESVLWGVKVNHFLSCDLCQKEGPHLTELCQVATEASKAESVMMAEKRKEELDRQAQADTRLDRELMVRTLVLDLCPSEDLLALSADQPLVTYEWDSLRKVHIYRWLLGKPTEIEAYYGPMSPESLFKNLQLQEFQISRLSDAELQQIREKQSQDEAQEKRFDEVISSVTGEANAKASEWKKYVGEYKLRPRN